MISTRQLAELLELTARVATCRQQIDAVQPKLANPPYADDVWTHYLALRAEASACAAQAHTVLDAHDRHTGRSHGGAGAE
jgi:hypothetical protein